MTNDLNHFEPSESLWFHCRYWKFFNEKKNSFFFIRSTFSSFSHKYRVLKVEMGSIRFGNCTDFHRLPANSVRVNYTAFKLIAVIWSDFSVVINAHFILIETNDSSTSISSERINMHWNMRKTMAHFRVEDEIFTSPGEI